MMTLFTQFQQKVSIFEGGVHTTAIIWSKNLQGKGKIMLFVCPIYDCYRPSWNVQVKRVTFLRTEFQGPATLGRYQTYSSLGVWVNRGA
jgi:hypothetical protein